MASAILGGLINQGVPQDSLVVIDPSNEACLKIKHAFDVGSEVSPGPFLSDFHLVVWAVKPQFFHMAALEAAPFVKQALHFSVAAGIRTDSIANWIDSHRVVRAMPNTPALIGKGITALFACAAVSDIDRHLINEVMQTTGSLIWLDKEDQLDAVTALSGSGPAYVFYFLEAMTEAGISLGLTRSQAYQLSIETFIGSAELAKSSSETPELLRGRVTSKGGTTFSALNHMEDKEIKVNFIKAIQAAANRAQELGKEFGKA